MHYYGNVMSTTIWRDISTAKLLISHESDVTKKTRSSIYDSTVTFDVITANFVPSQLILNVYG